MSTSSIYKKGEALTIILIVAGGGFLLHQFVPKIKLPWEKSKNEIVLEQKVNALEADKKAAADLAKAQDELAGKHREEMIARKEAADRDYDIKQKASNSNARAVAAFTIDPPDQNDAKDLIVDNAITNTAKALPTPENWVEILKEVRRQMDSSKTTIAELKKQLKDSTEKYDKDVGKLTTERNIATTYANGVHKEIQTMTETVTTLKEVNDKKDKEISGFKVTINNIKSIINRYSTGLGVLGIVLSVVGIASGWFLSKLRLIVGAVIGLIASIIILVIPAEVYMWVIGACGVVIVGMVVYTIIHHIKSHNEDKAELEFQQKGFDRAIGAIQEFREANPELFEVKMKKICADWINDDPELAPYIDARLKELNVIAVNENPNPLKRDVVTPTVPDPLVLINESNKVI